MERKKHLFIYLLIFYIYIFVAFCTLMRQFIYWQIIISVQNNLDDVFVSVLCVSLVLSSLTLLHFVKISFISIKLLMKD